MMLEIADILDGPMLDAIQQVAGREDLFTSGAATAGWHAKERKHNLQASGGLVDGVLRKITQQVMQNELIQAAAQPRAMAELLLSRYEPGMYYGNHVDNALMNGKRADLSFTLFLSPPEAYEGGALIIDEPAGERHIKLPAGSLVLYPSSTLHRVEEVTSGTRIAAVGWLSSFVRDAYKREIIFDLERSIANLRTQATRDEHTLTLLLKTRSNLFRLWTDS